LRTRHFHFKFLISNDQDAVVKTESSMRYEAAVLEMLDRQFLPRGFRVEGTRGGIQFRHPGRYSRTACQLDGTVFAFERPMPFLVADAKCHTVKLDVKDVEMFLGMMDDVGAPVGMLVAPFGYTPAATRRSTFGGMPSCHDPRS
jgi:hypothetical protein